jgi:hypothetical protein
MDGRGRHPSPQLTHWHTCNARGHLKQPRAWPIPPLPAVTHTRATGTHTASPAPTPAHSICERHRHPARAGAVTQFPPHAQSLPAALLSGRSMIKRGLVTVLAVALLLGECLAPPPPKKTSVWGRFRGRGSWALVQPSIMPRCMNEGPGHSLRVAAAPPLPVYQLSRSAGAAAVAKASCAARRTARCRMLSTDCLSCPCSRPRSAS